MTEIPVALSPDLVGNVMDRLAPQAPPVTIGSHGQVNAPGATSLDAAKSEAWAKLTELVRSSAVRARNAMRDEVRGFVGWVKLTCTELGRFAQAFEEWLVEKLRVALASLIDAMLGQLRAQFAVGGRTFMLKSVQIDQKIGFSADLETNVLALCKLVGEGELAVSGTYELLSTAPTA